jgi:hypothetical protein
MYEYRGYIDNNTIYVEVKYNGNIIGTRSFNIKYSPSINGTTYTGINGAIESTKFEGENFGICFGVGNCYPAGKTVTQSSSSTITSNSSTSNINSSNSNNTSGSTSGTTIINFDSPDTSALKNNISKVQENIKSVQSIGLPTVINTDTLWKTIEMKKLTQRQSIKKMLIDQNQMSEQDAHLCVYGKVSYKNGELCNDNKNSPNYDPNCLSKPGDEDYEEPIDEKHPLWQNIDKQTKELKDNLFQLGIKLGEFTFAIPNATAVIATSLISLVASATILPFGAGLPNAIASVQTMLSTIKQLQSKTAELLPLLAIVDIVAIILPKDAQIVIAQINAIYAIILTILTSLTIILGLLDKVLSALNKSKSKVDAQELNIDPKANPSSIKIGESTTLTANATGGGWDFTYEWLDYNGTIISRESEVVVTPNIPSNAITRSIVSLKYTCKVTNNKGIMKQANVTVKRI